MVSDVMKSARFRLAHMKTRIYRRISGKLSEEDILKERINSRIRKLGSIYVDGNSDCLGYTYHPIPFSEFSNVNTHRIECESRLRSILEQDIVRSGDWILDIGANVGYFAFGLARNGAYVEAYEADSDTFEIGAALSRLYQQNVIYINKPITEESLRLLRPHYRIVLLLSVYHWIVKQQGLKTASNILSELARRADYIFMETPSKPGEAMFQHEVFTSGESIERYVKATIPESVISQVACDNLWGDRILYRIDCRNVV